jgi:hypothetical protein
MTQIEFTQLHGECDAARLGYIAETEITFQMLAACLPVPLSFQLRLALAAQGIAENEAHSVYMGMRNLLLEAARFGYGNTN